MSVLLGIQGVLQHSRVPSSAVLGHRPGTPCAQPRHCCSCLPRPRAATRLLLAERAGFASTDELRLTACCLVAREARVELHAIACIMTNW